MKIGLQIPNFTWPGGASQIGPLLSTICHMADDLGFYSLWVMDHLFQMDFSGSADEPMLESYATLGYIAGQTRSVKLGTLVTAAIYRHPAVLVKSVTTLDVLSGGRAYLGIGAGWYEREAVGLGIPFPPWSERFERLEEILNIVHRMWSGRVEPYHGKYYTLREPINQPQPLTHPHPPVMVGGMGEKKTLRLVARYADACNFTLHGEPEMLCAKLDALKRHCDDQGRDYEQIERTVLGGIDLRPGKMSIQAVRQLGRDLAKLGFQHWIINLPAPYDIATLERVGETIIPDLAEI